jgi:hypothetical protein
VEEIPRVVFVDKSRAEENVYVYLTRDNVDLHFGEKWDIPSSKNRWKKTSAADAAYRKILNETGIVWSKVLHLRSKSGMDKAGTVGVSQDASASMSKHTSDKINHSIPQLQNEIYHAMTGFLPNMEYYAPRILLLFPWLVLP